MKSIFDHSFKEREHAAKKVVAKARKGNDDHNDDHIFSFRDDPRFHDLLRRMKLEP